MLSIKPLDSIRVVSIALNLPGPVAIERLVSLGANVTKIEPTTGDPLAMVHPSAYAELHAGVDIQKVDLKSSDGRRAIETLLADADLFITSSRLGALERLGLGWDRLANSFPNLCQVAIIGHAPPQENHPGHDLTYQAEQGLVTPPQMPRTTLADLGGALEAVIASMALLIHRGSTRRAAEERYALVSLSESAEFFARTVDWGLSSPGGVLGGGIPQYNLYETTDGWIAIAALEPHFWQRFLERSGLEHPDVATMSRFFKRESNDHWCRWSFENELPIVVVNA